jgi:mono/diheme cytochrome c family protein
MHRIAWLLTVGVSLWVGCCAMGADALPPSQGGASGNAAALAPVTFNKDIAPILFNNCVSCHRPGEVAPFSLLDYKSARKHAKEIDDQTATRSMPPWKPEPGFGDFIGVRRLNDAQISLIHEWVRQGKQEGNPSDLPAAPQFPGGWRLGEPDMVVKMPKAYTLRADGPDDYRCFVIPLNLKEDTYVTAVDFHASNPRVVHHALFFLDTTGKGRELQDASNDGAVGYYGAGGPGFRPTGGLGGWAPGVTAHYLPDDVGRIVRAGSDLVIQIHFHPSGKVEQEQSSVALYFTKTTPKKIFVSFPHSVRKIDISPGDNNYVIDSSFTVPGDVELQGVFPHAHLLCRSVKVTADLPDGTTLPLIWIKDWDWNWQGEYLYKTPIKIPRGTKITQHFVYDNSSENIHNPNTPPREVKFGEQTGDEMSLVFYQLVIDRGSVLDRLREMFRGGQPPRGQ